MLTDFREKGRGGERERETWMQERNINQLSPVHTPTETKPTTQACALTRNQTGDLLVYRTTPNQLSHTTQGKNCELSILLRKEH